MIGTLATLCRGHDPGHSVRRHQSLAPRPEQFQYVVPCADEPPLIADFLFAPQQKLPESSRLLDLAENWLRQLLAPTIAPASLLCHQLAPHPIR